LAPQFDPRSVPHKPGANPRDCEALRSNFSDLTPELLARKLQIHHLDRMHQLAHSGQPGKTGATTMTSTWCGSPCRDESTSGKVSGRNWQLRNFWASQRVNLPRREVLAYVLTSVESWVRTRCTPLTPDQDSSGRRGGLRQEGQTLITSEYFTNNRIQSMICEQIIKVKAGQGIWLSASP
jgi:hypothetical protein